MPATHNIIERLLALATAMPRQTALIQPGLDNNADKSITFAELEQQSAAYARFFLQQGLSTADRAILLMPPGIEFYTLFLALARIGIAVMLVDPGVGLKHFKACIRQVPPTMFLAPPKGHILRLYPGFCGRLKAFSPSFMPFARTLHALPLKPGTKVNTAPALAANHPALVTFTSGSTGRPKAILRTHGFLLRQAKELASLLPARPGQVEFCTLPVFTLSNLAQGITTLLPPAGAKLAHMPMPRILAAMQRHNVTKLLAAPHFCHGLCLAAKKYHFAMAQLCSVHTGGGPVHVPLLKSLQALAPKAAIYSLYGSTEAEPVALQPFAAMPEGWLARVKNEGGLPAGKPVACINLRIIADCTGKALPTLSVEEFNALCLPFSSAGEIVVSGKLVQRGYMNPADDAETKIHVGETVWHRTGDAGYQDADGTLWLLGRCGAKVNTSHGPLYPFAVEAAASLLPGIFRAAVVQTKHGVVLALEGQKPCKESLDAFILEHKCVEHLVFMPQIPVDTRHHSKVLYAKLRQMLEKGAI